MRKHLGAVVLALAVVLPLWAGIRSNVTTVNDLEIDAVSFDGSWDVSSPTLRRPSFGYLAYDLSGESPKVFYSKETGQHTTWAFMDIKKFTRELYGKGSKPGSDLEQTGYTMELRATAGPFKGWYLAREGRSLVLVKDQGKAASIRLVVKTADIEHK